MFHKSCDLKNEVLFLMDLGARNIMSGAVMIGFQGAFF